MMQKFFKYGSGSPSSSIENPNYTPPTPTSTSSTPSTPSFSNSNNVFSTTAGTGPARPLRLVYFDEKGKFRMDPEAVATLQLVKGPIGVVSVCGRARQGKSFILNQ
ncbi:Guanylate-binding protein, partial [Thalictrum thalictroides]